MLAPSSSTLRALKDEANRLMARGKFRKSMNAYQALIALVPRDPLLHLRHAEANRRLGLVAAAITSYRQAAMLLQEAGHEARATAALNIARGLEGETAAPSAPLTFEVVKPGVTPARAITVESFEVKMEAPEAPVEPVLPEPTPASVGSLVRLSDRTFAFRAGPDEPWVMLRSDAPIHLAPAVESAETQLSDTTH